MEKTETKKKKERKPRRKAVEVTAVRNLLLDKIAELDSRYAQRTLSHDGYAFQIEEFVKNMKVIQYKN